MTLREPPKQAGAANIVGRMLGLLLLLAVFAVVVWTAATLQQVGGIERTDPLVHAPGDYVAVEGSAIHYQTVGTSGTPTVLVHDDSVAGGLLLVDLAGELADTGRRVVIPDLVGFGFSSRPSEPGPRLATSGQAETLASLLDELESGPAELVGIGWGGEVAAELAVSRPDLVTRLVLVDTPAIPVPRTGVHQLEALPFGLGAAVAYNREGAALDAESRYFESCPGWIDCDDPEVQERYRQAASVPGTARAIWARRASDPAAVAPTRLAEIGVPVTVVAVDLALSEANALASSFAEANAVVSDADGLAEAVDRPGE